ncbi:Hydrolase, partial [Sarracenia purpurea var. burkii]
YRTVTPDLRGYNDADAPSSVATYTVFHIVDDLVALLDAPPSNLDMTRFVRFPKVLVLIS